MLVLLEQRNKYLSKTEFENVKKVERKMTQIKKDKYEELIVPNTFYCTFMHGEGQQRAIECGKIKFASKHTIDFKPSKSPSDILWLNRGIPRLSQMRRGIFVMLIVFITSIVTYFIFITEI